MCYNAYTVQTKVFYDNFMGSLTTIFVGGVLCRLGCYKTFIRKFSKHVMHRKILKLFKGSILGWAFQVQAMNVKSLKESVKNK